MNTTCSLPLLLATLLLLCGVPLHGGTPHTGKVGDEVIAHYTRLGDKEKLRAAKFLVENMKYHYFKDSPGFTKCFEGIEEINSQYKYPDCLEQYQNLFKGLGNPYIGIKDVPDQELMDAKSLIDNIDMAFEDWRNGLWAKHLSFDEFCEFLLPYRIGNEKITVGWRKTLREVYMKNANSILTSDDMKNSAFWAANKVNDALKSLKFKNRKVLPVSGIELPLFALKNMRMGECSDYAEYTTYVMRACGIPVCFDFTPQWPDRSGAHHWNALIDNTGLTMPFMGVESNPGYPSKQGRVMAKVFRRTFAYQPQSLYAQNLQIGELVPENLNTPFIKDVSDEYFKGHTLTLTLNKQHLNDKFAYIAVFDNQKWVPVDFGVITKDRTVTFQKMGADIIYLPVYWGRNGSVPAGNPILLTRDGKTKEIKPNKQKLQSLVLNRKYPHNYRIVKFRGLLKNGHFEASNHPDFTDAEFCAEIKQTHLIGYDTLNVKTKGKYRYWRYVSPVRETCNLAELKFLKDKKPLGISHVLSEGMGQEGTNPENVFDGDELTYYMSDTPQHGWVGADFGKSVLVDQIACLARNDDNDIVDGHTYELCYFENGKQKSFAMQIAKGGTVIFKNVPTETVYILHDLTKGREERIFLYEQNKIYWY